MKKLFLLVLLIASASLQGCMTYSHNSLQKVDQWPLASPEQEKPSVYLKVHGEYQVNDNPRVSTADVAKLEQVIAKTLSESGRFSRVTTEQEESDLYMTVTLRNHETGSMGLAMLTGATLFLIPGAFDNTLTMDMVVRDEDGNKRGVAQRQESLTTWMHLLLIFAVPFQDRSDNLLRELTQSTLQQAVDKQLL
ncbi:hypothetical protein [Pseudomonas yangonensis]|jgi:hypothetical protein|uniref:hypothetical protein n=1 Tax=Pseudomonas yangonensis TaxID=2579922 RepID=UPI00137994D0|nr:hypothetical protein [Pseudomonas yangonensis]